MILIWHSGHRFPKTVRSWLAWKCPAVNKCGFCWVWNTYWSLELIPVEKWPSLCMIKLSVLMCMLFCCEKNPRKIQLEGGRKLLGSLFKIESQIWQWQSMAAQTTLSMSPGEWGWSPHGQLPGRKILVRVGHNILPKTPNLEHPAKTSLVSSETKHSTEEACGEHIFQPWPSVCPLTTQKSR